MSETEALLCGPCPAYIARVGGQVASARARTRPVRPLGAPNTLAVLVSVLFTAVAVLPGLAVGAPSQGPAFSEVAEELACQCGCTMTVSGCSHNSCGSAATMKTRIRKLLGDGMSKQSILANFVNQYGDVVLAAPPKRGFNLLAWFLPFVALIAGGGVIYSILRRWSRPRRQPVAAHPTPPSDPEYAERLQRELSALD